MPETSSCQNCQNSTSNDTSNLCTSCIHVSNEETTLSSPSQTWKPLKTVKTILSIQSTVVHGYVGNKAAQYPLQLLGFDVDPLNTVQLSNHTSYPVFKGDRFTGEQIEALLQGLEANNLVRSYDYILSGYLGTSSTLPVIGSWIKKLKESTPNLKFVLDPVMGDQGKLYVSEQHVDLYKHHLLPLADVVLPNGFEAETLTGIPIVDEASARQAMDKLHKAGPRFVAITSVTFPNSTEINFFGSERSFNRTNRFSMSVKPLPVYFSGTGDLVSALILAHLDKNSNNSDPFKEACTLALASTQAVLQTTFARMKTSSTASAELQIVACRDLILHPHTLPQPHVSSLDS